MRYTVHHGDCLTLLPTLADASVDLVLTDLPYGVTYAEWDTRLPMAALWAEYRRIIKGNGAIVLTATQPFTALLIASNPTMFRCEWIWDKVHAANFANAKRQPLKVHESVLVFAKGQPPYYPLKTAGPPNHAQGAGKKPKQTATMKIRGRSPDDLSGQKFPRSIVVFPKHSSQCGLHPTQKPVALGAYFIRTYSAPDALVLDNCMGSGSFGVAALQTGRRFIGMESDPGYFAIATARLAATEPCDDASALEG